MDHTPSSALKMIKIQVKLLILFVLMTDNSGPISQPTPCVTHDERRTSTHNFIRLEDWFDELTFREWLIKHLATKNIIKLSNKRKILIGIVKK